jgi:hypothetical protein
MNDLPDYLKAVDDAFAKAAADGRRIMVNQPPGFDKGFYRGGRRFGMTMSQPPTVISDPFTDRLTQLLEDRARNHFAPSTFFDRPIPDASSGNAPPLYLVDIERYAAEAKETDRLLTKAYDDLLTSITERVKTAVADVEASGRKAKVAYYEGKVYVMALDDYEFNRAEVEQ